MRNPRAQAGPLIQDGLRRAGLDPEGSRAIDMVSAGPGSYAMTSDSHEVTLHSARETPEADIGHIAEDLRSIAAVERFRTLYDSDWPAAIPSLARRLHDHVAYGDCPLGRRQSGAAAHLIGRRA